MKKSFDKNNPPNLKAGSAQETCIDYDLEANLKHVVQSLDAEEDNSLRLDLFTSVVAIAEEISKKDGKRACDIVIDNLQKMKTYIPDDIVEAMIGIAERDPQIEKMSEFTKICGGYDFKQLHDVPEVTSLLPLKGAVTLLSLLESYAFDNSPKINEVRGLLNAIDPAYKMPEGAGIHLH